MTDGTLSFSAQFNWLKFDEQTRPSEGDRKQADWGSDYYGQYARVHDLYSKIDQLVEVRAPAVESLYHYQRNGT